MSDQRSIVNLGDWGKPATVLIEKISDAIGGAARPYQIVRVALAEAKAETIRAQARIGVAKLEKRAMRRFQSEEAKKQANMEAIIAKALPEVTDAAHPAEVEDDWIANCFDKCRLISDQQMQKLWARILAGEANSPGRFSKMTVNVVSNLEARDAYLFSRLCSFAVSSNEPFPLVYAIAHPVYTERGINFESVSHLENIGLINLNIAGNFAITNRPQNIDWDYFGHKLHVEFRNPENNNLDLGHVFLTLAGRQLATVCAAEPSEGFLEFLTQQWEQRGYKIKVDSS